MDELLQHRQLLEERLASIGVNPEDAKAFSGSFDVAKYGVKSFHEIMSNPFSEGIIEPVRNAAVSNTAQSVKVGIAGGWIHKRFEDHLRELEAGNTSVYPSLFAKSTSFQTSASRERAKKRNEEFYRQAAILNEQREKINSYFEEAKKTYGITGSLRFERRYIDDQPAYHIMYLNAKKENVWKNDISLTAMETGKNRSQLYVNGFAILPTAGLDPKTKKLRTGFKDKYGRFISSEMAPGDDAYTKAGVFSILFGGGNPETVIKGGKEVGAYDPLEYIMGSYGSKRKGDDDVVSKIDPYNHFPSTARATQHKFAVAPDILFEFNNPSISEPINLAHWRSVHIEAKKKGEDPNIPSFIRRVMWAENEAGEKYNWLATPYSFIGDNMMSTRNATMKALKPVTEGIVGRSIDSGPKGVSVFGVKSDVKGEKDIKSMQLGQRPSGLFYDKETGDEMPLVSTSKIGTQSGVPFEGHILNAAIVLSGSIESDGGAWISTRFGAQIDKLLEMHGLDTNATQKLLELSDQYARVGAETILNKDMPNEKLLGRGFDRVKVTGINDNAISLSQRGVPFSVDTGGFKAFAAATDEVKQYGPNIDIVFNKINDPSAFIHTALNALWLSDKDEFYELVQSQVDPDVRRAYLSKNRHLSRTEIDEMIESGTGLLKKESALARKMLPFDSMGRKKKFQDEILFDFEHRNIIASMGRDLLAAHTERMTVSMTVDNSLLPAIAPSKFLTEEQQEIQRGIFGNKPLPSFVVLVRPGQNKNQSVVTIQQSVWKGSFLTRPEPFIAGTAGTLSQQDYLAVTRMTGDNPDVIERLSRYGADKAKEKAGLLTAALINSSDKIALPGEDEYISGNLIDPKTAARFVKRSKEIFGDKSDPDQFAAFLQAYREIILGGEDKMTYIEEYKGKGGFFFPAPSSLLPMFMNKDDEYLGPEAKNIANVMLHMAKVRANVSIHEADTPTYPVRGELRKAAEDLSILASRENIRDSIMGRKSRAGSYLPVVADTRLPANMAVMGNRHYRQSIRKNLEEQGFNPTDEELDSMIADMESRFESAFIKDPIAALDEGVLPVQETHRTPHIHLGQAIFSNVISSGLAYKLGLTRTKVDEDQVAISIAAQARQGGDFDKDAQMGTGMMLSIRDGKLVSTQRPTSVNEVMASAYNPKDAAGQMGSWAEIANDYSGMSPSQIANEVHKKASLFVNATQSRHYAKASDVTTGAKKNMGLMYNMTFEMRAWYKHMSELSGVPQPDALTSFEKFRQYQYQLALDSKPLDPAGQGLKEIWTGASNTDGSLEEYIEAIRSTRGPFSSKELTDLIAPFGVSAETRQEIEAILSSKHGSTAAIVAAIQNDPGENKIGMYDYFRARGTLSGILSGVLKNATTMEGAENFLSLLSIREDEKEMDLLNRVASVQMASGTGGIYGSGEMTPEDLATALTLNQNFFPEGEAGNTVVPRTIRDLKLKSGSKSALWEYINMSLKEKNRKKGRADVNPVHAAHVKPPPAGDILQAPQSNPDVIALGKMVNTRDADAVVDRNLAAPELTSANTINFGTRSTEHTKVPSVQSPHHEGDFDPDMGIPIGGSATAISKEDMSIIDAVSEASITPADIPSILQSIDDQTTGVTTPDVDDFIPEEPDPTEYIPEDLDVADFGGPDPNTGRTTPPPPPTPPNASQTPPMPRGKWWNILTPAEQYDKTGVRHTKFNASGLTREKALAKLMGFRQKNDTLGQRWGQLLNVPFTTNKKSVGNQGHETGVGILLNRDAKKLPYQIMEKVFGLKSQTSAKYQGQLNSLSYSGTEFIASSSIDGIAVGGNAQWVDTKDSVYRMKFLNPEDAKALREGRVPSEHTDELRQMYAYMTAKNKGSLKTAYFDMQEFIKSMYNATGDRRFNPSSGKVFTEESWAEFLNKNHRTVLDAITKSKISVTENALDKVKAQVGSIEDLSGLIDLFKGYQSSLPSGLQKDKHGHSILSTSGFSEDPAVIQGRFNDLAEYIKTLDAPGQENALKVLGAKNLDELSNIMAPRNREIRGRILGAFNDEISGPSYGIELQDFLEQIKSQPKPAPTVVNAEPDIDINEEIAAAQTALAGTSMADVLPPNMSNTPGATPPNVSGGGEDYYLKMEKPFISRTNPLPVANVTARPGARMAQRVSDIIGTISGKFGSMSGLATMMADAAAGKELSPAQAKSIASAVKKVHQLAPMYAEVKSITRVARSALSNQTAVESVISSLDSDQKQGITDYQSWVAAASSEDGQVKAAHRVIRNRTIQAALAKTDDLQDVTLKQVAFAEQIYDQLFPIMEATEEEGGRGAGQSVIDISASASYPDIVAQGMKPPEKTPRRPKESTVGDLEKAARAYGHLTKVDINSTIASINKELSTATNPQQMSAAIQRANALEASTKALVDSVNKASGGEDNISKIITAKFGHILNDPSFNAALSQIYGLDGQPGMMEIVGGMQNTMLEARSQNVATKFQEKASRAKQSLEMARIPYLSDKDLMEEFKRYSGRDRATDMSVEEIRHVEKLESEISGRRDVINRGTRGYYLGQIEKSNDYNEIKELYDTSSDGTIRNKARAKLSSLDKARERQEREDRSTSIKSAREDWREMSEEERANQVNLFDIIGEDNAYSIEFRRMSSSRNSGKDYKESIRAAARTEIKNQSKPGSITSKIIQIAKKNGVAAEELEDLAAMASGIHADFNKNESARAELSNYETLMERYEGLDANQKSILRNRIVSGTKLSSNKMFNEQMIAEQKEIDERKYGLFGHSQSAAKSAGALASIPDAVKMIEDVDKAFSKLTDQLGSAAKMTGEMSEQTKKAATVFDSVVSTMKEAESLAADDPEAAAYLAKNKAIWKDGKPTGSLAAMGEWLYDEGNLEKAYASDRVRYSKRALAGPSDYDKLSLFGKRGAERQRALDDATAAGWYGYDEKGEGKMSTGWKIAGTLVGGAKNLIEGFWVLKNIQGLTTEPLEAASKMNAAYQAQSFSAAKSQGIYDLSSIGAAESARNIRESRNSAFTRGLGQAYENAWMPYANMINSISTRGAVGNIAALGGPAIATGAAVGFLTSQPLLGVAAGALTAGLGALGTISTGATSQSTQIEIESQRGTSGTLPLRLESIGYLFAGKTSQQIASAYAESFEQFNFGDYRAAITSMYSKDPRRSTGGRVSKEDIEKGRFSLSSFGSEWMSNFIESDSWTQHNQELYNIPDNERKTAIAYAMSVYGGDLSEDRTDKINSLVRFAAGYETSGLGISTLSQQSSVIANAISGISTNRQSSAYIQAGEYLRDISATGLGVDIDKSIWSASVIGNINQSRIMSGLDVLDWKKINSKYLSGTYSELDVMNEGLQSDVDTAYAKSGIKPTTQTLQERMRDRQLNQVALASRFRDSGFSPDEANRRAYNTLGMNRLFSSDDVTLSAANYVSRMGLVGSVGGPGGSGRTDDIATLLSRGFSEDDIEALAQAGMINTGSNRNDFGQFTTVRNATIDYLMKIDPTRSREEVMAANQPTLNAAKYNEYAVRGSFALMKPDQMIGLSPERAEGVVGTGQAMYGQSITGLGIFDYSAAVNQFRGGSIAVGSQITSQLGMAHSLYSSYAAYGGATEKNANYLNVLASTTDARGFAAAMATLQGDPIALSSNAKMPWMYQVQTGQYGGTVGMQAGYDEGAGALVYDRVAEYDMGQGGYAESYARKAGYSSLYGISIKSHEKEIRRIESEQFDIGIESQRNQLLRQRNITTGAGSWTTGVTATGAIGDLRQAAGIDTTVDAITKKTLGELIKGLSQWALEDKSTTLSRTEADFSFQMGGKQLELSRQKFSLGGKQFYESYGLRKEQLEYDQGYQGWQLQFGRKSELQSRQWQYEDIMFQRNKTEINFAWNMEDSDRNIRYARGMERINLLRQRERAVVSHSMDMSQSGREEERWKERNKLADESFTKEKERFEKSKQWAVQQMEMDRRHFEENRVLQAQEMELEKIQFLRRREFELQQREIEDQGRAMRRAQFLLEQTEQENLFEKSTTANMALRALNISLENFSKSAAEAAAKSQFLAKTGGLTDIFNNLGTNISGFLTGISNTWNSIRSIFTRGHADGGYTGDSGSSFEPVGVVHPREYVVPEKGALVIRGDSDSVKHLQRVVELLEVIAGKSMNVSIIDGGGDKGKFSVVDSAYGAKR